MSMKRKLKKGKPIGQIAIDSLHDFEKRYAHDPTLLKEVQSLIHLHSNWMLTFLLARPYYGPYNKPTKC